MTTFFLVDERRDDQNTTKSGPSSASQRNTILLASGWWSNIEFWPSSFAIFQGIRTSITKKTFFVIFMGVRTPCRPPPLWIPPCQSRNFQPCGDVSWVEPVLNRVKYVSDKETIWCLKRDSNQRPLYLKSSTLPLTLQVLYSYLVIVSPRGMSRSHLKLMEI